ncbi:hypothetical protein FA15DRAFT_365653 [Coprinopsis marcescibilis]|uniref:Uncharacterized protein n=1 Tax=Coprinopsis marcescibilis TaxID=230819 RepID=A0A5C3KAG3_COPMA|nr:hypothetical protein FA15DRAFT_365653 [Coprinopsis marcescibilis]
MDLSPDVSAPKTSERPAIPVGPASERPRPDSASGLPDKPSGDLNRQPENYDRSAPSSRGGPDGALHDRFYDRDSRDAPASATSTTTNLRDFRDGNRRDWVDRDRDRRPYEPRFSRNNMTTMRRPPPEERHYEPAPDRQPPPPRRFDVKQEEVPISLSDAEPQARSHHDPRPPGLGDNRGPRQGYVDNRVAAAATGPPGIRRNNNPPTEPRAAAAAAAAASATAGVDSHPGPRSYDARDAPTRPQDDHRLPTGPAADERAARADGIGRPQRDPSPAPDRGAPTDDRFPLSNGGHTRPPSSQESSSISAKAEHDDHTPVALPPRIKMDMDPELPRQQRTDHLERGPDKPAYQADPGRNRNNSFSARQQQDRFPPRASSPPKAPLVRDDSRTLSANANKAANHSSPVAHSRGPAHREYRGGPGGDREYRPPPVPNNYRPDYHDDRRVERVDVDDPRYLDRSRRDRDSRPYSPPPAAHLSGHYHPSDSVRSRGAGGGALPPSPGRGVDHHYDDVAGRGRYGALPPPPGSAASAAHRDWYAGGQTVSAYPPRGWEDDPYYKGSRTWETSLDRDRYERDHPPPPPPPPSSRAWDGRSERDFGRGTWGVVFIRVRVVYVYEFG